METSPPSTQPVRDVTCSADGNFVRPLAVTLASLASAHTSSHLTIHVVYEGIERDDREKLEQCAAPHEIRWVQPDISLLQGIEIDVGLSHATLFRLLLGELLPDVTTVLYLDADTIVEHDLDGLLSTSLNGSVVAAVRDAIWSGYGYAGGPEWIEFDVPVGNPFFNAGVMLIDLDAARTEQLGRRCLELTRVHRFADQDPLNLLTRDRWLELHPRWNVQSNHLVGRSAPITSDHQLQQLAAAIDDPAIVHLTAAWAKPWRGGLTHPWSRRWLETLDTTPYAGWRPEEQATEQLRTASTSLRRSRATTSRWIRHEAAPRVGRTIKSSDSLSWRRHRTLEMVHQALGGRVGDGPFRGVRVPDELIASDSVLPSQLLGTYRHELEPTMREILALEPSTIVMLGCGDVIHPTGFATLLPNASISVIHTDDDRRHAYEAIAGANDVADRIRVTASLAELEEALVAQPAGAVVGLVENSDTLVPVLRSARGTFAHAWLLIEGRRRPDPTSSPAISSLFAPSHEISLITRTGRDPFAIPVLSELGDVDRWLAVDDQLDETDHWLWLTPRSTPLS